MWAIGNGESRTPIDIDRLTDTKIGCNAIFRDYQIDHIVCVDRRMMEEALRANANQNSYLYTRNDWWSRYSTEKRTRIVPDLPYAGSERWDEPFQWGSGPYAVLLAAKKSKTDYVNLLGFDLHSKTKTVNNVYKNTPNYDAASKKAVDPRYWVHQIGMVFKYFPKIKFKIYQEPDWVLPKAWKYTNVSLDNISNISYNN